MTTVIDRERLAATFSELCGISSPSRREGKISAYLKEAFAALGLDWRDHVVVDPALFRPADIAVSRANPAKAARELGWEATMGPADVARAMAAHEQQEIASK